MFFIDYMKNVGLIYKISSLSETLLNLNILNADPLALLYKILTSSKNLSFELENILESQLLLKNTNF